VTRTDPEESLNGRFRDQAVRSRAVDDPRVQQRVAVVVATRDRPDMLDRCLRSVRAALRPDDELLVVDSASVNPHTVARVARRHGALLLRCEQPGVDRARNVGWRASTAPLVLFTDDDVEVEATWADAYRDGIGDHGFATGWIGACEGSRHRVAVIDDPYPQELDRSSPAPLGHGASTAVRRAALEAVGGWDEQLGAGSRFRSAPETDLYDRLLARGYLGAYLPAARAVHDQWRSDRQVPRLHLLYAIGAGARLAKLLRTDRSRLRHAARETVWSWGVRDAALETVRGRPAHAAVALLRLVGYGYGFAIGLCTAVQDGHYAPRRAPVPWRPEPSQAARRDSA
jgi:glycosyltransferase involved in cell wall biosynthesis